MTKINLGYREAIRQYNESVEEKFVREICNMCEDTYTVKESEGGHCLCDECKPKAGIIQRKKG